VLSGITLILDGVNFRGRNITSGQAVAGEAHPRGRANWFAVGDITIFIDEEDIWRESLIAL